MANSENKAAKKQARPRKAPARGRTAKPWARPPSKSRASESDSAWVGPSVSRGHLRADARQSVPAPDLHDPFGAMHRRAREHGYTRALQEVSNSRRIRLRQPARYRRGNPLHGLLPQQDQIDPGRQQKDRRGI